MLDRFLNFIINKFKSNRGQDPLDILSVCIGAWGLVTLDNALARSIRLDLDLEMANNIEEAYSTVVTKLEENPELRDKLIDAVFKALERESFRKNLVYLYLMGLREEVLSIINSLNEIKSTQYLDVVSHMIEKEIRPIHGVEVGKEKVFSVSVTVIAPLHLVEKVIEVPADKETMVFEKPIKTIYQLRRYEHSFDDTKIDISVSYKFMDGVVADWSDKIIANSYMSVILIYEGQEHYLDYIKDVVDIIQKSGKRGYKLLILFIGSSIAKVDVGLLPKGIVLSIMKIESDKELLDVIGNVLIKYVQREVIK